jgi:hypothetical protein
MAAGSLALLAAAAADHKSKEKKKKYVGLSPAAAIYV